MLLTICSALTGESMVFLDVFSNNGTRAGNVRDAKKKCGWDAGVSKMA